VLWNKFSIDRKWAFDIVTGRKVIYQSRRTLSQVRLYGKRRLTDEHSEANREEGSVPTAALPHPSESATDFSWQPPEEVILKRETGRFMFVKKQHRTFRKNKYTSLL